MSIKASVPIPIETMERLESQSASDPPSIRPRPSWKLAVVNSGGAAAGRTAGYAGHADRGQRTAHPRLGGTDNAEGLGADAVEHGVRIGKADKSGKTGQQPDLQCCGHGHCASPVR